VTTTTTTTSTTVTEDTENYSLLFLNKPPDKIIQEDLPPLVVHLPVPITTNFITTDTTEDPIDIVDPVHLIENIENVECHAEVPSEHSEPSEPATDCLINTENTVDTVDNSVDVEVDGSVLGVGSIPVIILDAIELQVDDDVVDVRRKGSEDTPQTHVPIVDTTRNDKDIDDKDDDDNPTGYNLKYF
jgi:hypothetical protein